MRLPFVVCFVTTKAWAWVGPAPKAPPLTVVSLRKITEPKKSILVRYRREYDVAFVSPSRRSELRALLRDPSYELGNAAVTILACLLFAVRTLPHLDLGAKDALANAEVVLSAYFACEWAVRWYASGQLRYLVKPLALVDLLSFLPAFVESWDDQLAFLRLLRVLRLQRLLSDAETFAKFRSMLLGTPQTRRPTTWYVGRRKFATSGGRKRKKSRRIEMREETVLQLARVITTLVTLLFVASGLIYTAEHDVNDSIPDFFTALYFGLTTLTTVGFGDIVPVTPNGRLVVSLSILVGIGIIPVQVTSLAESLLATATTPSSPPSSSAPRRLVECRVCGKASPRAANFCSACGTPLV